MESIIILVLLVGVGIFLYKRKRTNTKVSTTVDTPAAPITPFKGSKKRK